jgi:DNA-binding transcriptional ArsR family regulator
MEDLTKYNAKAELLKVLAHPVRLCIVKGLMDKECNVSHMQECLELPQSTVSQHLSVLRSRGIIKGTRRGLEVTYSISNEEVKKLIHLLFD